MSQFALPRACQRPVKFGLPSGMRGICAVANLTGVLALAKAVKRTAATIGTLVRRRSLMLSLSWLRTQPTTGNHRQLFVGVQAPELGKGNGPRMNTDAHG